VTICQVDEWTDTHGEMRRCMLVPESCGVYTSMTPDNNIFGSWSLTKEKSESNVKRWQAALQARPSIAETRQHKYRTVASRMHFYLDGTVSRAECEAEAREVDLRYHKRRSISARQPSSSSASAVVSELSSFAPASEHTGGAAVPVTDIVAGGDEEEEVQEVVKNTASHLCHNPNCLNPNHLVWEALWINQSRNFCPAGKACTHSPKCFKPHTERQYPPPAGQVYKPTPRFGLTIPL